MVKLIGSCCNASGCVGRPCQITCPTILGGIVGVIVGVLVEVSVAVLGGVSVGVGVAVPWQLTCGEELLRGVIVEEARKSLELSSVSTQPLLARTILTDMLGEMAAPGPSKQLAVP